MIDPNKRTNYTENNELAHTSEFNYSTWVFQCFPSITEAS